MKIKTINQHEKKYHISVNISGISRLKDIVTFHLIWHVTNSEMLDLQWVCVRDCKWLITRVCVSVTKWLTKWLRKWVSDGENEREWLRMRESERKIEREKERVSERYRESEREWVKVRMRESEREREWLRVSVTNWVTKWVRMNSRESQC